MIALTSTFELNFVEAWQSSQTHRFRIFGVEYMELIYSIQFRCNPAVSSHLFPFSAVQHSHGDTCCQQQHGFLIAAHNPQHFQAPIQELISQHVPLANLNITRNSASPKQSLPHLVSWARAMAPFTWEL